MLQSNKVATPDNTFPSMNFNESSLPITDTALFLVASTIASKTAFL